MFYMFSHRKKKLLFPAFSKQSSSFPMHHILKTAQCAEQLSHSERFLIIEMLLMQFVLPKDISTWEDAF